MNNEGDGIYLTIIIPVYNEAKKIRKTLKGIIDYLKKKDFPYQVLIVNDGSKDNTVEVVEKFFKEEKFDNFSILDFKENRGKGFVVKQGMLAAKGEYILFIDADSSAPIEEFDKFRANFDKGYDIFIGTRKAKGEIRATNIPLHRAILGLGFSFLARKFLATKVWDFTCGFKCYQKNAVQPIFSRQVLDGWSFDAEDLFLAQKLGFKVKEIPIRWNHYQEDTKVNALKEVFKSGWELLKIRINDLRGLYR
ncbi:MAG: glycosyltransferase family 2 protein [Proteobacteria bacterium]|nr:glycosyltransferase family 2 protein [Pseudomonadota bacterium]